MRRGMRRLVRSIGLGVLGLGLAASLAVVIVTVRTKLPSEEMTTAGFRRSTSQYVKMRDGVEIAVTIDLPSNLKSGERLPVLMRTTHATKGSGGTSLFLMNCKISQQDCVSILTSS